MEKYFNIQFVKYILVGILNTIFGYFTFALLLFAGLHYSVACVLSTVISVMFNFKTYQKLVFKSNNKKTLFRFIFVYFLNMILNILGLKLAKILNMNLYFAGFILICILALVSFLLLKYFVFEDK